MIPTDPNLLTGHEPNPTKEPAITSGAVIPKEGKTLAMINEQNRRDELRRKKLLRQIHNAQCEESGNLAAMDFGDDDETTL